VSETKILEAVDLVEAESLPDEASLFLESKATKTQPEIKKPPHTSQKSTPSTQPKDPFALKPLNEWFKFSPGYGTALFSGNKDGSRESLKLSISMSPIKNFFIGTTLHRTVNSYSNPYYEPDFSYSFGYMNWSPDTFSLLYSNYANNKFFPKEDESRFNFQSGLWDLSYNTKIEGIKLRTAFNYTHKPKVYNLQVSASKKIGKFLYSARYKRYLEKNQNQLTLSAKGYLYKKLFASGSMYFYSHPNKQTSLEQDYAVSFGWKDLNKGYSILFSTYYQPNGAPFRKGNFLVNFNF
jgi:hypothetical protein